jgi:hypothetical protein
LVGKSQEDDEEEHQDRKGDGAEEEDLATAEFLDGEVKGDGSEGKDGVEDAGLG